MKSDPSRYFGDRFPREIISYAVWAYHRFCLSFRDVEDLLVERGIIVSYETIRQWCEKFGPGYARNLKRREGRLGDHWLCVVKPSSVIQISGLRFRSVSHVERRYGMLQTSDSCCI